MNIDPNYLPAIPTRLRQWIYLLFLLGLFTLLGIDAFWDEPGQDPWWLAGALRVMAVVQVFIMGVVLAHTRQTVAEQIKGAEKRGEPLPAAFSAVPESRAVPVVNAEDAPPMAPGEDWDQDERRPGDLGLPENLRRG